MKKTWMLSIILLVSFLLAGLAVQASTVFTPVKIRTRPLTMTGERPEEPAGEPRDFQFTPVRIRTKTMTMTGMGEGS